MAQPIDDEAHVDERRAAVGLELSAAYAPTCASYTGTYDDIGRERRTRS